jgi:hypothetical protein
LRLNTSLSPIQLHAEQRYFMSGGGGETGGGKGVAYLAHSPFSIFVVLVYESELRDGYSVRFLQLFTHGVT